MVLSDKEDDFRDNKDVGLLDKLCELSDSTYLSDLRKISSVPLLLRVGNALEKIMSYEYTPEEWIETIFYVLDKQVEFPSAEEARQYFINECFENK